MRHVKDHYVLVSCVVFGLFSLLAVMTGGLAKGGNKSTQLPQTKHSQNANFHPFVEREGVNWLDRVAV